MSSYPVVMATKHETPNPQELKPPKSIEQLRQEQGIPDQPPDYVELASAVWRTKKELRDFQRHIKGMRHPSK